MHIAAFAFALFCALILPVCLAWAAATRLGTVKPVLLGAACFTVFQLLTRLPIISYLLPSLPGAALMQAVDPLCYIALIALSAGVFEECGRYILMRAFMKDSSVRGAAAFGIGHGGIEALLLTGLALIASLFGVGGIATPQPALLFLSGAERLFAMAAHVCFSIMVWRGVERKSPILLIAAVILHGAFDFIPLWLTHIGCDIYVAEGAVCLMAAALAAYTGMGVIKRRKNERRRV